MSSQPQTFLHSSYEVGKVSISLCHSRLDGSQHLLSPHNEGAPCPTVKTPIEVAVPLDAINRKAAREKAASHGHPFAPCFWYRTPHPVYLQ